MKTIQEIKEMLSHSEGPQALAAANEIIESAGNNRSTLATYLEAMELDPDGPAAEAYRHLQELLAYYHKDYYNP